MQRVELPIVFPPKTLHQFYALPLSIIMTNPESWSWYYSQFMQLHTFRDDAENIMLRLYNIGGNYEYAPLEQIKAESDRVKLGEDIINLIKIMLRNGYYTYVFCDIFHLKALQIDKHNIHDILIYSYDDAKEEFGAFAYVGTKLGRFTLAYSEFYNAYYSSFTDGSDRLSFYRMRQDVSNMFDLERVKWHMLDYIEGVDTLARENPYSGGMHKARWGVDIYDELMNMYKFDWDKWGSFAIPETYCLLEHKIDHVKRMKYLQDRSLLFYTEDQLQMFEQLESTAKILVNLLLKANAMSFKSPDVKDHTLEKISKVLYKMKATEITAFESYFKTNSSVFGVR